MDPVIGMPAGVGAERFDTVGSGRSWSDGAHEAQHFAFGPMFREGEKLEVILFGEVRREQDDGGEVELAIGDLLEDDGNPGQQVAEDLIRTTHQAAGVGEQVGICERLKLVLRKKNRENWRTWRSWHLGGS